MTEYIKLVARQNLNKPRGFRRLKNTKWYVPKQFMKFRKKRKVFIYLLEDFIGMVQKVFNRRSAYMGNYKEIKNKLDVVLKEKGKHQVSVYLSWLKIFISSF